MSYIAEHTFIPAEWWPQAAIMIAWPHLNSDWAEDLANAEAGFTVLADAISQHQGLVVICQSKAHQSHIEKIIAQFAAYQQQRIHYCIAETNDTWCRDFGPIGIIKDQQTQLIDFQFNAWGERYPYQLDNQVNQALAKQKLLKNLTNSSFILEGGSIESNGIGTLLTTSHCLINSNRNSGNKAEIEKALLNQLPIKEVLWLDEGTLIGDDTDSHIDNLARFISHDTIVYSQCNDPNDAQYESLTAMEQQLKSFKQQNGEYYKLIPLTLPKPCYSKADQRRLPASYVNFLIMNNAVLVPQFDDPQDEPTINALQKYFPAKKIIGIDSRTFIEQNGGIHCLTIQLMHDSLAVNLK